MKIWSAMAWHRFLFFGKERDKWKKESGVEPPHSKVARILHETVGHQ
jgi:hypothetical protein